MGGRVSGYVSFNLFRKELSEQGAQRLHVLRTCVICTGLLRSARNDG